MVELWRAGGPGSLHPASAAAAAEAEGWDGQSFMDSQSLGADPYVLMAHWAEHTERLMLATGVTNPLSRHPVAIAAAAATLQATSGERHVLGLGRGDSALAYLGSGPTPLRRFEQALRDIQALLRGQEVTFAAEPTGGDEARPIRSLSLGDRPEAAQLRWLPPDLAKVPLDVAASGPKVIAMAARIAERVTFSVGASAERVGWALELARKARAEAGLAGQPISYGLQIPVVCHRDGDTIREAATRIVMPLARFQIMERATAAGPGDPADKRAYDAIRRGYDMTKHSDFSHDKLIGERVDFGFIRRFAVVGDPEQCTAQILALAGLGIDRFVVVGPGLIPDGRPEGSLFTDEVIPAVRAATSVSSGPAIHDGP
ncbi:MAG: LLM class flavin-dependent oxidoreductase [Nocardioidaceae bacterium]